MSTAVHLLNRLPSKVLNFKTPLQVLASHISLPTTLMLPPRVFGCVAYVHLHKNQRTKLDPCARRCLFLGYVVHQKSYRCYDPFIRRTYVTMDVTFLESKPFFPAPTSSLQGETQDKEQKWLHFDWPNSEIVVDEAPSLMPIDPTRLDGPTEHHISSENYTPSLTEPSSLLSLVHANPPLENIFEVSILDTSSNRSDLNTSTGYTLPFKENHGKPPTKYSPDIEK